MTITSRRTRSDAERRIRAFPDAVEFVALAIRAGHTPTAAVLAARPHAAPELDAVFGEFEHRLARGAGFADALAAFADELGAPARTFVDALATAVRYGLPIGPVLDRLVDDAREHRRRRAEISARRLPVLLAFPLVTCTLPSFVLLAVVPAVLGALRALDGGI